MQFLNYTIRKIAVPVKSNSQLVICCSQLTFYSRHGTRVKSYILQLTIYEMQQTRYDFPPNKKAPPFSGARGFHDQGYAGIRSAGAHVGRFGAFLTLSNLILHRLAVI